MWSIAEVVFCALGSAVTARNVETTVARYLGGGRKLMMGSLIQTQFAAARNWPFGSALAICLLVIVLLLLRRIVFC